MIKRVTSLLLVVFLLSVSIVSFGAEPKSIYVYIDGESLAFTDAKPFIDNGRTLVPFRVIAEALGAKVDWDGAQKKVTITKDQSLVEIIIGNKAAKVNDTEVKLDVPAVVNKSRTFVPLRFVGESLDRVVKWDGTKRRIDIEKPKVYLTLDKNTAEVNDIITLAINVDINKIAGYEANLKFDETVLQPVDLDTKELYAETTAPSDGTLLSNKKYSPTNLASSTVDKGILHFGKSYMSIASYKNSNIAESSGTVALVGFKVLKKEKTTISFEEAASMKDSNGFAAFDWDGKLLENFELVKSIELN